MNGSEDPHFNHGSLFRLPRQTGGFPSRHIFLPNFESYHFFHCSHLKSCQEAAIGIALCQSIDCRFRTMFLFCPAIEPRLNKREERSYPCQGSNENTVAVPGSPEERQNLCGVCLSGPKCSGSTVCRIGARCATCLKLYQPCCRKAFCLAGTLSSNAIMEQYYRFNCDRVSILQHKQDILPCGHIGCNLYEGECIVCDAEKEKPMFSARSYLLEQTKNEGVGNTDYS
jgi:hypothetical protein